MREFLISIAVSLLDKCNPSGNDLCWYHFSGESTNQQIAKKIVNLCIEHGSEAIPTIINVINFFWRPGNRGTPDIPSDEQLRVAVNRMTPPPEHTPDDPQQETNRVTRINALIDRADTFYATAKADMFLGQTEQALRNLIQAKEAYRQLQREYGIDTSRRLDKIAQKRSRLSLVHGGAGGAAHFNPERPQQQATQSQQTHTAIAEHHRTRTRDGSMSDTRTTLVGTEEALDRARTTSAQEALAQGEDPLNVARNMTEDVAVETVMRQSRSEDSTEVQEFNVQTNTP